VHGRPRGPGILLGFLEGRAARTWGQASEAARRAAVTATFARSGYMDGAVQSGERAAAEALTAL